MKKTVIVLLTALLLCGCSSGGSASAGKTAATAAAKASESTSAQASASATAAPAKTGFDSAFIGTWLFYAPEGQDSYLSLANFYTTFLPDGTYIIEYNGTTGKATTDSKGNITFSDDSFLYSEESDDYTITGYQYAVRNINGEEAFNYSYENSAWTLNQKNNCIDLNVGLKSKAATSNKIATYKIVMVKQNMYDALKYTLGNGIINSGKWTDNYGNIWEFTISPDITKEKDSCTLTQKDGKVLHSTILGFEDDDKELAGMLCCFDDDSTNEIEATLISISMNEIDFTQEDGSSLILTKAD